MGGSGSSYYEKIGGVCKCIDNELPFDLPEDWCLARFSSLWRLLSGRDLQTNEYNDDHEGIPYITGASNFSHGKITINRWTTAPQVITQTGDLLITCKGTVGEMSINTFGEAHIARQIMAIRNNYGLNIEYLQLVLSFYIDEIKNAAKGLIPGISRENILGLLIPVPPENYQSVVVASYRQYENLLSCIEMQLR